MCNFADMKDEKNTQLAITYTFKKRGVLGLDYDEIEESLISMGIPINKIRVRNAVISLNTNGFITKRGSRYYPSYKLQSVTKSAACRRAVAK